MHYVSVAWKLLFALIPPTDYMNGWLTFIISIVTIGVLTAIIGDAAALFGCTIGLKDSVGLVVVVVLDDVAIARTKCSIYYNNR